MSEDWSEKTEAPTPYRRTEARRRGQVARSAEVPAAALCLAAVMLIHHSAPTLLGALKLLLADSLTSSQPHDASTVDEGRTRSASKSTWSTTACP